MGQAFLSPTLTQYYFLTQWNDRKCSPVPVKPLSAGDLLDKAALMACLGGRFSPGIDLTFTVRQLEIYVQDWRTKEVGPFRIAPKPFDYDSVKPDVPVLSEGYVPLHTVGEDLVEPGDMTKFMSVPWHTDYNSCATHPDQPDDPQQHDAVLVVAGVSARSMSISPPRSRRMASPARSAIPSGGRAPPAPIRRTRGAIRKSTISCPTGTRSAS